MSGIVIEPPKLGQGWGGTHPPTLGGGGGNGPEDGYPDYGKRLHRARLALLLGIASISVLFITISAVYFLRQAAVVIDQRTGQYVHEWAQIELPVRLLLLNTIMLLVSSLTMELARRAIAREMVLAPVAGIAGIALDREIRIPWLGITVMLGLLFLSGQWLAWKAISAGGVHAITGGAAPFFYVLTGAHAAHLSVGIMILIYAGVISMLRQKIEHRRIVLEVTSWYWHFMGLLWIYVFALLQFGR